MPDWLAALLASPLVIGAATFGGREVTKWLTSRSEAQVARSEAETARLNAETERMLAEARMRESQSRITESDATALRNAFATAMIELQQAREEMRRVLSALEEERYLRADAEEHARRMRQAFTDYHAQVRAGRPPKHTPQAFAAVDHTIPFGTQGKNA